MTLQLKREASSREEVLLQQIQLCQMLMAFDFITPRDDLFDQHELYDNEAYSEHLDGKKIKFDSYQRDAKWRLGHGKYFLFHNIQ